MLLPLFALIFFSYPVVVANFVVIVVVVDFVIIIIVVVVVAIKWQKVICCEGKIHSLATFKLGKFCDRAAAAASGDQLISG